MNYISPADTDAVNYKYIKDSVLPSINLPINTISTLELNTGDTTFNNHRITNL